MHAMTANHSVRVAPYARPQSHARYGCKP